MIKKILLASVVIFIIVIAVIFVQALLRNNFSLFARSETLKVADKTYNLEIADTPEEHQKGLSGRKSLPENRGMLFTFDKPDYHSFWMKDMEFPIDIIFVNGEKVVTVYGNVPPPASPSEELLLYQSDAPANRVIELNAGEAKKDNIKKGDTLDLSLE
jgi:uncharacterized protein